MELSEEREAGQSLATPALPNSQPPPKTPTFQLQLSLDCNRMEDLEPDRLAQIFLNFWPTETIRDNKMIIVWSH